MKEEGDPVWELLGHASCSKPGPYFVRRVMRGVHQPGTGTSGWTALFRWFVPAAAAASVALALGMSLPHKRTEPTSVALSADEAFAIAAGFEDLMGTGPDWGWMDF